MNRSSFALVVFAFVGAAGAHAQQGAPADVRGPVPPEEIVVSNYVPRQFKIEELMIAANGLFGSSLALTTMTGNTKDANGFATVPHFVRLGEMLLIRDTAAEAKKIVDTLAMLEDSEAERRTEQEAKRKTGKVDFREKSHDEPATSSREFRPRYVSFQTLQTALKPFERQVTFARDNASGWTTSNITPVLEGNVFVVCETPARMKDLETLVDRIDRPSPQMTISAMLVQQTSADEKGAPLPAELVDNLQRLVPSKGFTAISVGLLRCSTQSGRQCELKMEQPEAGSWSLRFFPDAYNPDTGELSISRCSFQLQLAPRPQQQHPMTQQFETSLMLKSGEYVVLGAVGAQPTFVVLRALPDGKPQ